MKNKLLISFISFLVFVSCTNNTNKTRALNPEVDLAVLTSDYNKWWSYQYHEIILSSDFIPLNEKAELISKGEFLKSLTSGSYVTAQMISDDELVYYKLFKLSDEAPKNISNTIKNVSNTAYKHYKMEGAEFPEFNIKDIDGNSFDNQSIKGKTTVIKTWFIACKPCIAEFPELNKLVQSYKDEDQLQFLSLATDAAPALRAFLSNKKFDYQVVSDQRDLIQEKLNLQIYPTHIIVDENGIIKKVVNKASELISYIDHRKEFKKSEGKELSPPPPPPPPPLKTKKGNQEV